MDKFTELAATAQVLSQIIGNPETGDFVLVEEPVPECVSQGLAAQGMRFCGLLGIVDGATRAALKEELSDEAYTGLAQIFNQQVMRVLAARLEERDRSEAERATAVSGPVDDFVSWANALHDLPDLRD